MTRRPVGRAWKKAIRGIWDAVASTAIGIIGGYQVLDPRRKILPRGLFMRSLSANQLSNMSLPQLRALCRKLERDNPTARAAVEGLVAQVVGTGIALEPDTGDQAVDDKLRKVWQDYIEGCDISGRRSIYDLQAQAFREEVIAGEHLWRLVVLPERASKRQVPLVVLPLECEWLDQGEPVIKDENITGVNGIELDRWGQPVAYNLINPEHDLNGSERVLAAEIIHSFERRRALQARGEPWLAPVIERIWQEGDLMDAELRSAVNCAAMALVITSNHHDGLDTTDQGDTDDPAQRIGIGSVARLYDGEDIKAFSHNRPSQQIAGFRRTIRGDISAACRLDQVWLDRDYKQAGNYTSRRAAGIDNERLLSPIREWFGHTTIGELYVRALPYLSLLAGVPVPKRRKYRLVPDGQQYIDPYKEVQASCMAIAAGLTTYEKEIGRKGDDRDKIWEVAAKEREKLKGLGLAFDLSGTNAPAPESEAGVDTQADDTANAEDLVVQQQKAAAVIALARAASHFAEADDLGE